MCQEFHLKTRQREQLLAGSKGSLANRRVCLDAKLVVVQAEQNRILAALSRQRDSDLWTVEATKVVRKTEFTV